MITEGLTTLLLAQTAVTDLVGQRIFTSAAPQGTPLPYIVMDRVLDEKHSALDGFVNARHVEIDIECWGPTPGIAANVSKVVSDFLDDFSGPTGGAERILSSHHMDEDDSFDPPKSGSDIQEFVTILNFEFQYRPA